MSVAREHRGKFAAVPFAERSYPPRRRSLTWPALSEDDGPSSVLVQPRPWPRVPELRPPFVAGVRVPHLVAWPPSATIAKVAGY